MIANAKKVQSAKAWKKGKFALPEPCIVHRAIIRGLRVIVLTAVRLIKGSDFILDDRLLAMHAFDNWQFLRRMLLL